jgi:outer membrane lipoprotein-sorting protein
VSALTILNTAAAASLALLLPARSGIAPGTVDPKAFSILAEVEKKLGAAKSLTAVIQTRHVDTAGNMSGMSEARYEILRPGYMRIKVSTPGSTAGARTSVYDGKFTWSYAANDTVYTKMQASAPRLEYGGGAPIAMFFTTSDGFTAPPAWTSDRVKDLTFRHLRYVGKETVGGASYDVIDWRYADYYTYLGDSSVHSTRFYVGGDKLIHRMVTTAVGSSARDEAEVTKIELGTTLAASDFKPTPPDNAKLHDYSNTTYDTFVGIYAMPFRVTGADGKRLVFEDFVQGKKALILNSWDTRRLYTKAALPHLERLYRSYKAKGLEILSVSDEATAEEMIQFQKDNEITIPFAEDYDHFILQHYKFHHYGLVVIVDPATRRVVYHGYFDRPAVMAVLADLGVK